MIPCDDFKQLFESMTHINPLKRPTIEEIKQSEWYNGPIVKKQY